MAVNLGQRLRDAVDGPGVNAVLGEDPAGFDLPALSARIRRRRRTRAGVTSAGVVAVAGVLAVAGVHGVGRGASDAGPPAVGPVPADLCGTNPAALPASDDELWLVSPDTSVVPAMTGGVIATAEPGGIGAGSLGVLSGRSLVTTLIQGDATAGAADALTGAAVALSRGGDVVATGSVEAVTAAVLVTPSGTTPLDGPAPQTPVGTGATFRATGITADLTACASEGDAALTAGSYAVQLVVPGPDGPHRAAAGPWLVRLLNASVPASLGAEFPSDEVPVVGGPAHSMPTDGAAGPAEWTVLVNTDSVDAVSFAADALRAAGAQVTIGDTLVVDDVAAGAGARAAAVDETAHLQQALTEADAALAEAETRVTELTGNPDRLQELAEATDAVQLAQSAVTQALEDLVRATERQTISHAAYRFREPAELTATTEHWQVTVTFQAEDLLTYRLTAR